MTKKEWIKEADLALNSHANSIFNANNWLSLIRHFMSKHDDITFTSRSGKELSLKAMLDYIDDSIGKASKAHTNLAELAKGLIHSMPDDVVIGERKGLFE